MENDKPLSKPISTVALYMMLKRAGSIEEAAAIKAMINIRYGIFVKSTEN